MADNKLVISGKRGDVYFPPSVAVLEAECANPNEHAHSVRTDEAHFDDSLADIPGEGRVTDRDKSESSSFGGLNGDDYSLLSMDDFSLQTDQESLTGSVLAVSGGYSETNVDTLTSCLNYYPDETAEAAPVENLQHQPQGDYRGHLSQPHRQDSSPHESMEQGNPTCVATSHSICKNQVIYRREVNYRFPKMKKYETRLKTFQQLHWQLKSPSAEKLAKANMFYEGEIEWFDLIDSCCV